MSVVRPLPASFALISGLWVVACQGADTVGRDLTVTDSAGVAVRVSSGAGLDEPLTRMLSEEPHVRIGTVAGGEETQFTYLLDAMRLSDGRLLVAESGAWRVRLFDQGGSFLNWIGSVGEGPAEYSAVASTGLLDGDTIWVHDRQRRGFVLYLPDGRFVRSFQVELLPSMPQLLRGRMLRGGNVVIDGSTFGFDELPTGADRVEEEISVSVMDREGRDPLLVAEAPGMTYQLGRQPMPDGREGVTLTTGLENRFAGVPVFAFGRDGVIRADPRSFEIREVSLEGELRWITRVQRARVPFSESMIANYEATVLESAEPASREAVRRRLDMYSYTDSLPHFGRVTTDDTGRVWLAEFVEHRAAPSGTTGSEPSRWWRLGREGGVDGFLDVPEGFRLLRIQGNEVWGAEADALDVPFLVAYRLVDPVTPN